MLLTDDHPIIRRRDENRAAWAKAQREAAAARAAKAAQRKSQASGSGEQTPVEHFNERHAIAELLGRYGYEQRGDSAHWRSPMQTTRGSYATRDYGGYWVSMSGSDAAAGVGAETRSGHRHGDAFDLFAFYEHGGDFSEAVHAYSLEAGLGGDGDWADVDWGEPEARRAGQGGEDDVADDGAGDEAGEGADGQAGEELAPGSGGDRAKANGHAKANGYYRANGHAKANGYDRANGHARANGRARNGAKRVIDFRKDSIWLSPDVEPVLDGAWLIRDWIPRRGLSVIYGASGAGKSHLAADMACHVARGEFWHGNPVEPGLVVYVALEGHGSLPNRVAALAQAFGAAPVWFIRARFSLVEMAGHVDALVRTIIEEAEAKGLTIRWVVIDTLARAMAGMDENTVEDMGAAVDGLEAVAGALDCAVTAVHHSGKDQARGERGSSSLRAAAETSIEVVSDGTGAEKVITATAGKVRDGEDGKTFMYRLAQAELGIDKWGRPVTSCTVEPLGKEESEERKKRSKVRKLSPRQRDGLESLRDAAERYGYRITGSEDYPPNRKVVPEDTWRDEFYRRVFSSEDSPATKRQAFHRVRLDLVGAGHVAGYDGKFWSTAPSEATGGQTCWA